MPHKDPNLEKLAEVADNGNNPIVYRANLDFLSDMEIEGYENDSTLLFLGYRDEVTCNECHKGGCTVPVKRVTYPDGRNMGLYICPDPEEGGRFEVELDTLRYWEINVEVLKEMGYLKSAKVNNSDPDVNTGTVPDYLFKREGDVWSLTYAGKPVKIKHQKGMLYISHLLSKPNKHFNPVELKRAIDIETGQTNRITGSESIPETDSNLKSKAGLKHNEAFDVMDEQGLKECSDRLKEIDSDIDKAKADCDEAESLKLTQEKEFIIKQLQSSLGKGDSFRSFGSNETNVKDSISKAINRAIKKFSEYDTDLSLHFKNSLQSGTTFIYSPEPSIPWQFD